MNYANCEVSISKEGILTAQINLNKPVGLSKSTKSISFGSTLGNKDLVFNNQVLKLGINCYAKNPKYVVTAEDKAHYKEIYSK